MGSKRFKDPIYGYIEIEENLIAQVVDTAAFQRSGVYHLGEIAAQAFYNSLCEQSSQEIQGIQSYIEIFKLACLLHDVGHAPFSHTGEQFYLLKRLK